jgi:hypothetical protein
MEFYQPPSPGSAVDKLEASIRAASQASDDRALQKYKMTLENVQLEETLRSNRFQEKVSRDQMRRAQWQIDRALQTDKGIKSLQPLVDSVSKRKGVPTTDLSTLETAEVSEFVITKLFGLDDPGMTDYQKAEVGFGYARLKQDEEAKNWDKWNGALMLDTRTGLFGDDATAFLVGVSDQTPPDAIKQAWLDAAPNMSDAEMAQARNSFAWKRSIEGAPPIILPSHPGAAVFQVIYPTAKEKPGNRDMWAANEMKRFTDAKAAYKGDDPNVLAYLAAQPSVIARIAGQNTKGTGAWAGGGAGAPKAEPQPGLWRRMVEGEPGAPFGQGIKAFTGGGTRKGKAAEESAVKPGPTIKRAKYQEFVGKYGQETADAYIAERGLTIVP